MNNIIDTKVDKVVKTIRKEKKTHGEAFRRHYKIAGLIAELEKNPIPVKEYTREEKIALKRKRRKMFNRKKKNG